MYQAPYRVWNGVSGPVRRLNVVWGFLHRFKKCLRPHTPFLERCFRSWSGIFKFSSYFYWISCHPPQLGPTRAFSWAPGAPGLAPWDLACLHLRPSPRGTWGQQEAPNRRNRKGQLRTRNVWAIFGFWFFFFIKNLNLMGNSEKISYFFSPISLDLAS